jgi:hypothetical protein
MPQTRNESRIRSSASVKDTDAMKARQSIDAKDLTVFVGEWHAEGQQIAGPVGPAVKVEATQTYEWLPGEAFLIHRFDGHIGDSRAACIEIIGCNRETGACRAHTFYNNGLTNVWDIERQNGEWRLIGDWNMGGKSMKVRCSISFGQGDKTMRSHWERSSDGSTWQTFWDLHAKKVIPH